AEGGVERRDGVQAVYTRSDRDLDRPFVARARFVELGGAVPEGAEQHIAQPRGGGRGRRGPAEGAQLAQQVAQASAASNASRAGAPWTANTIRSRPLPASMCRRTSSTSIR